MASADANSGRCLSRVLIRPSNVGIAVGRAPSPAATFGKFWETNPLKASGVIFSCWLRAGTSLVLNSVCTAERPAMSAWAVSMDCCVSAGRKSVIRFSKAGPTANRLLMSVIATRPAPTNMTKTAATLLRKPDLLGEDSADVPALDVVMPLSSSRSEDMKRKRRAGERVPVAFRRILETDQDVTVTHFRRDPVGDESLVTRAG